MRKLTRTAAPTCLGAYDYRRDTWTRSSPDLDCRQEIWRQLYAMQGQRCAYCERAIDAGGHRHIEHFRRKNPAHFPHLSFAWDNLFGSCWDEQQCGKQKDKSHKYDPNDLLKPDVDDPFLFLYFAADGSVHPRSGIAPDAHYRAEVTIATLRLDFPKRSLRSMRRAAIAPFEALVEEIGSYLDDGDLNTEEIRTAFQPDVDAIALLPFAGVILSYLRDNVPEVFFRGLP